MIPKIIHQIWIGDKSKMPKNDIQTWIDNHPEYEYILWDEARINKLNLVNRDKYDIYYNQQCYHGSSDIARIEILYQYGGVYLDADSICNNPIDDLLNTDFFAGYSPNIKGRVGNAFFGSTPNHEILKTYIDEISKLKNILNEK
jgi:mannosyltransferase OCH1-like enzyme